MCKNIAFRYCMFINLLMLSGHLTETIHVHVYIFELGGAL